MIDGALGMAKSFNISERIIGVTIVSIGASIPELAASIIAVLKKEKAISFGNLIGSNMFNILGVLVLGVLGLTAIITPIKITDLGLLSNDIFWMLAISFLILPLNFVPSIMKLDWRDGLILLSLYSIFMYRMFI